MVVLNQGELSQQGWVNSWEHRVTQRLMASTATFLTPGTVLAAAGVLTVQRALCFWVALCSDLVARWNKQADFRCLFCF